MERFIVVAVVVIVAVAVAAAGRRRQPSTPVRTGGAVPTHVDRDDFPSRDAPWLVVAFTSATCRTCAATWSEVRAAAGEDIAVVEAEAVADRAVHQRYGIDSVPLTVVVDADGSVRRSFLGPLASGALAQGLAELTGRPAG